jgi:tetratricopeptide (TPR) repeat protein
MQRRNLKEPTAGTVSLTAVRESIVGKCQQIREDTARSLALSRDWVPLLRASGNLARCGDLAQAQSFGDEAAKQIPQNMPSISIWLQVMQAVIENARGDHAQAIQILQPAIRYESASIFWIPWLRGQAYLKLNQGAEAAAEFQKILDHRGWDPASILYPLAHLNLGRAAMMQGDAAKARKSYQDFFALWKDADADLPILIEAKREYEKVK